MRIGVISDTHIPHAAPALPPEIYTALEGADMILHAGDIVRPSVLEDLRRLAKVEAVYGNMDGPELRELLPAKKIIKAGRFRIGLIHGSGAPFKLMETVKKEFPSSIDVIVFGHSHSAVNESKEGILFFNPGSLTDKVFAKYNSYGILTVNGKIEGKIIRI